MHLHPDTTFEQWVNAGLTLDVLTDAVPWCRGDWMLFGEQKFGQDHTQALPDPHSPDGQKLNRTFQNCRWVADRFPPSRRRGGVSFSHHAAVAALDPPDQERWLDEIEKRRDEGNPIPVTELRESLAIEKAEKNGEPLPVRSITIPVDVEAAAFRIIVEFGHEDALALAKTINESVQIGG